MHTACPLPAKLMRGQIPSFAAVVVIAYLGCGLCSGYAAAQCTSSNPCVGLPLQFGANAWAVSSDGSVAVGTIQLPTSIFVHAAIWRDGTAMDLGVLAGGLFSAATGISADGSVVVGGSNTGSAYAHAFRWTAATGMRDLGALDGHTYSIANGISANGAIIVGESQGNGVNLAVRWVGGENIQALATLPGARYSTATAVNADGTVIVGASALDDTPNAGAFPRAVRWKNGGIEVLGTLGEGTRSSAQAVSADGSVVVGQSNVTTDVNGVYHAFRWVSGTMTDLGTLPGHVVSTARGVSADGRITVGTSYAGIFPQSSTAFRWTAATGMKDLNALLVGAGVNMGNIVLTSANGISNQGAFIVGRGLFNGEERGYVVRYDDGVAGATTGESVRNSVAGLSVSRFGAMAQQHALVAPLLGNDKPIGNGNEVGVFAAAGSITGGAFARLSTGYGLAIIGGVSLAEQDYAQVHLQNATIASGAIQYLYPGVGWLRPFVEAGAWLANDADLTFDRTYDNGAARVTAIGKGSGDLTYVSGRAGIVFGHRTSDQLAISAEYGREQLHSSAYSELNVASNPFAAIFGDARDRMDLAKLRLQWSHQFGPRIDATLWAAAVHAFNRETSLQASVAGVGSFSPGDLKDLNWAEFGLRVGYALSQTITVDAFANGLSGRDGIDTRAHGGAAVRVRF